MKAIYVSDDGKYFTDPEECRAYELSQNGYEVEIFEAVPGDSLHVFKHFSNILPNKQKCQRFVADYIHGICAHFKNLEKCKDYKITVRHKDEVNTFGLLALIEEVPAHYKIDTNTFDKLIH
jgi:hypothetical protein